MLCERDVLGQVWVWGGVGSTVSFTDFLFYTFWSCQGDGSLLTGSSPSLTFIFTDQPPGALNKIQALPRPMGPSQVWLLPSSHLLPFSPWLTCSSHPCLCSGKPTTPPSRSLELPMDALSRGLCTFAGWLLLSLSLTLALSVFCLVFVLFCFLAKLSLNLLFCVNRLAGHYTLRIRSPATNWDIFFIRHNF